eukprot:6667229-Ditylum_brightwellii.AAC.1
MEGASPILVGKAVCSVGRYCEKLEELTSLWPSYFSPKVTNKPSSSSSSLSSGTTAATRFRTEARMASGSIGSFAGDAGGCFRDDLEWREDCVLLV